MITAIDNVSQYLLDPLNHKNENKELAIIITIIAGILTLGIAQGLSALWRLCRPIEENETHKKINELFRKIFYANPEGDEKNPTSTNEPIHKPENANLLPSSPVINETLPIDNSSSPVINETLPIDNSSSPVINETLPIDNSSSPVINETLPIDNSSSPVINETPPIVNPPTNTFSVEGVLTEKEKVDLLVNRLNAIAEAPSWKEANINILGISHFVNKNLRLLNSQTQNPETAPPLKRALLAVSSRITKEAESVLGDLRVEYNNLAFEVQGYALGIYTDPEVKKGNWGNFAAPRMLPIELREKIFSYLAPQDSKVVNHLENVASVSNAWNYAAIRTKKNWVDEKDISPKTLGCKTAKEAVTMIIEHRLKSANLSDFRDLTDEDLKKLAEGNQDLERLFIPSSDIITEKCLAEALLKFPKFTTLRISYNSNIIGNALGEALSKLKDFTSLDLTGCNEVEGNALAKLLLKLQNLTYLNLSYCDQINEEAVYDALSKLTKLEVLNLDNAERISEEKLAAALVNLQNLKELNLGWCELKGEEKLVEAISQLTNLRTLNLSGNPIEEENLVKLISNLKNLKALNLTNCTQILGQKLAKALSGLTNLRSLNLRGCTEISGGELIKAISKLTNLTVLVLGRCDKINEEDLIATLKVLHTLKFLRLSECTQIKGEEELIEAFSNLTNLTTLDLYKCDQILEKTLVEGLCKLSNLTNLNLSHCNQISKENLIRILSNLPYLKELTLPFKDFMSEKVFSNQISKLTELKVLTFHGSFYRQATKDLFKKKFTNPNLKIEI